MARSRLERGLTSVPLQEHEKIMRSRSLSPQHVPARPIPEAFPIQHFLPRPPCVREETARGQRLFEIETLLRGKSLGELNRFNEQLASCVWCYRLFEA